MVLLGGDLFDDNRPSRATVVRALSTLNKYTSAGGSGSRAPPACTIALAPATPGADPATHLVGGIPNFGPDHPSTTLPVFTIHGNHDDPGGADNLSAVDMLAAARAVNYFGKVPLEGSDEGRLRLAPLIVGKGGVRLALYGCGAHREDRMARVFRTPGAVVFEPPPGASGGGGDDEAGGSVGDSEDEGGAPPPARGGDTFNLFVLHQNRDARGRPSASGATLVDPRSFPDWMDYVVWGHEHECRGEAPGGGDPRGGAAGDRGAGCVRATILQPGSTVITALTPGEAVPKAAFLLEVARPGGGGVLVPHARAAPGVGAPLRVSRGEAAGRPGPARWWWWWRRPD